jgi:prepilin-type N-terminal cleavage/methylation domain-containing protein
MTWTEPIRCARRGFTLIEVMAAVLVLGLLYTVLAGAAMRGLRSEGTDRRRAEAAMIADRELSALQQELAGGAPFEDGPSERDQDPFTIRLDVERADVLAMLPAPLHESVAREADPKAPSVLHDERGQSRLHRITVSVEWDEAGESDHVERTTYVLDTSDLAQFFPSEGDTAGAGGTADDSLEALRKDAPPELQALLPRQKPARRSR